MPKRNSEDMNLALQKRHEQLERWRQNEEIAERLQQEAENEQENQQKGEEEEEEGVKDNDKLYRRNASKFDTVQQQTSSSRTTSRTRNKNNNNNNDISQVTKKASFESDTSTSRSRTRSSSKIGKRYATNSQDGSRVKFNLSTLFLNACANGDLSECKRMLDDKLIDINATTCDGLTGLHEAAICGNIELLEFLLKQGANIDCCDNEGWTPLHAAASLGQTEIVKLLLKYQASVTIVNCENFLAYDLARTDEVRDLIGEHMKGYDIDQLRRQEELMIENDIERWIKTGHYEERSHPLTQATMLHVLAAKGYVKLMKRILETPTLKKQINLEASDNEGFTPLLAASFWNQDEIVELLIEHGANIFAQANSGYKISSIVSRILVALLCCLAVEKICFDEFRFCRVGSLLDSNSLSLTQLMLIKK